MSELQATLEIQVELTKFYNVDLFQRGYYQVRTSLRTPAKTPVKVEVSLPRNSDCPLVFPASVINGVAVSKTFQILYRNEDVTINDVILFKVHMLVDAQRIEECIDTANMELSLEIWFTDEEFGMLERMYNSPEQQEKLQCISQRVLKLHFTAAKGLHHHVPVLFDYFHLATVCVTVHGTLLALHQPYMNLNKQPKSGWVKGPESTLESVLFGARPAATGPSRYTVNPRLQQACRIYRGICSVLLSSYESLQASYEALNAKLPPYQQIKIEHHDCHKKLEVMCEVVQNLSSEEEFLQMATSDVSTLCAENVILWSQYQEMVTMNDKCIHQLAREHHNLRIKRFAEGFFTFEFPKHAMVACYEPSIHGHTDLAAMVRSSNYFMGLLPLPAESWDMDGDHTTLPIIFEDVYCEPHAKHVHTTSEGSSASRSSSDAADGSDRRSGKHSSDTSSVHSGDSSSPKLRRSKLKLIKNLKPDIIKRPSSFIVNDPNNTGSGAGNVAGITPAKTDCTLVGYRKIHADAPVYELGTLSPTGSLAVMEPGPTKSALYNAASMPTLLAKGHVNMVQSGSMPELNAGATYPSNPELLAALQVSGGLGGERRSTLGGAGLVSGSSQDLTGSVQSQPSVPVPNGADPGPAGVSCSSMSSSPSDSGSTNPNHIENGYVSSNSESNSKSSPSDPCGLKSDQLTGDHEGDVQAGLDYASLADTLSKALGEPETNSSAAAVGLSKEDDNDDDDKDFAGGSKPDGLLLEYMSQFDGSDSGRGDSSFSDAPLSDSTRDRLGSLIASHSMTSSGVITGSQGTLNGVADGMPTSLDGSLSGNEYTIFELLKEEMDRKGSRKSTSDSGVGAPGTDKAGESKTDEKGEKDNKDPGAALSSSAMSTSTNSDVSAGGQLREKPITKQPRPSSIVSSSSTPELSSLTREKEQKLVSPVGDHTINFITAKETLRRQMKYNGHLYSDFPTQASTVPYYLPQDMPPGTDHEGIHLIVCVHGLDGNSADLRLVRTYLEMAMPGGRIDFLMSERNQPDTFADFEVMTDRLVTEVLYHIEMYGLNPARVSFIGHSLGNLIIRGALSRPDMAPILPKLYTFLSLSGPHLGSLYNTSGLVNMGMWFMQKWKKSGSLLQLSLKDSIDPRQSFIYKLSQKPGMEFFKNVLLVGSVQDRYVPFHSTRIELCKSALKDTSGMGAVYAEMVSNILQPIAYKSDINFVRYDVFHALPNTANSLIGRAAHIAVLDSELFIEKFVTVSALKYFK